MADRDETLYEDARYRFTLRTGKHHSGTGLRSSLTEYQRPPGRECWEVTMSLVGENADGNLGSRTIYTTVGQRATQRNVDALHGQAREKALPILDARLAQLGLAPRGWGEVEAAPAPSAREGR